MMSMERGLQYEKQIRSSLEREGHQAKLWLDVPEEWLEAAGIIHDYNRHRALRKRAWREGNPLRDTGVDLVVKRGEDYELVQCKNYTNMLYQSDLAGFFRHIAYFPHLKGSVYHSDARLSCTLELPPNFDRIKYVHEPYVPCVVSKGVPHDAPKLVLRDYQRDAVTAALRLLTASAHDTTFGPRTMLNLACGCGKTICAATVANSFDSVVVFSPTKVLSEQNLTVFSGVLDRYSVLVDSDGIRDVQVLKGDLKVEKKWLISATFKSADVIQALLESSQDLSKTLIVIDEVHGLSRAQVTDVTNPMNKILWSKIAILSMSATPRIYELDDEDTDYENLFGPICYRMNLETAIERGLTTDYRVYIPLVHEIGDENEIMRECGLDVVRKDTTAKCTFLLKGMLQKGARRCIVYLDTHDAIEDFFQVLQSVACEYYGLGDGFWASALTSGDGPNVRKKTLDRFATFEGISIVLSSQILNEGIDVVSCDSVFFASPCRSKIRIVQRVCRANRLDPDNPAKVAHVFVWADELDECVNLVGALKEFDSRFCEKIDVISRKYEACDLVKRKTVNLALEDLVAYVIDVKQFMRRRQPCETRAFAMKVLQFIKTQNDGHLPNKEARHYQKWLNNFRSQGFKHFPDIASMFDDELPFWRQPLEANHYCIAQHAVRWSEQHDGALPEDKENKKLYDQIANLQNLDAKGNLNSQIVQYLDIHLEIWRKFSDARWHLKAKEIVKWSNSDNGGHPPREKTPVYGVWLKHLRAQHNKGQLPEITSSYLHANLRFWHDHRQALALETCKALIQFCRENKAYPSSKSKLLSERSMASWYFRYRSMARGEPTGKKPSPYLYYDWVICLLDDALPGWRVSDRERQILPDFTSVDGIEDRTDYQYKREII